MSPSTSQFEVWPRVHRLNHLYIGGSDRHGADMYASTYGEERCPVPDRRSLAPEAVMLGVAGTNSDVVSLAFREVASVHRGNAYSFHVVSRGASKLEALAELAFSLGVDRTQVTAFGDGLNDVEPQAGPDWARLGKESRRKW